MLPSPAALVWKCRRPRASLALLVHFVHRGGKDEKARSRPVSRRFWTARPGLGPSPGPSPSHRRHPGQPLVLLTPSERLLPGAPAGGRGIGDAWRASGVPCVSEWGGVRGGWLLAQLRPPSLCSAPPGGRGSSSLLTEFHRRGAASPPWPTPGESHEHRVGRRLSKWEIIIIFSLTSVPKGCHSAKEKASLCLLIPLGTARPLLCMSAETGPSRA